MGGQQPTPPSSHPPTASESDVAVKLVAPMPRQCHLSPEICRIPVGVLVEASSPSQVASPAVFAHPDSLSLKQDSALIGNSLDRQCVRREYAVH